MLPAALNASASSGVGAAGAAGLVGFDLCGGGNGGPSPFTGAPLLFGAGAAAGADVGAGAGAGAGASKAPGMLAAGGGETGPSESTSMGSDIMDSAESLFLSASLRFSGWVSRSRSALRRAPWPDFEEEKLLERLLCEEPCSLRDF